MKRRVLQYLFLTLIFFSPGLVNNLIASDTYLWIGGSTGEWTNPANWHAVDANMDGVLPAEDGDVLLDVDVTVTISAGSDIMVESVVLMNGAELVIASGATLTTTKGGAPGSNGFRLDGEEGTESSLTVNGILNINTPTTNAPNDGLDINDYTSVTVGATGTINIVNAGAFGIEINDDLTNHGTINVTNSTEGGVETKSVVNGSVITNRGSMTIATTGGNAVNMVSDGMTFENHGTIVLSGASGDLVGGMESFNNYGTFGGDGTVDAAIFFHQPGSTLAPGTSAGTLIFNNGDNAIDLSGITLEIEINGTTPGTEYDQIQASGAGNINLTGAVLELSGSHITQEGDQFTIVNASSVSDTLTGAPFVLNGVLLEQISSGVLEFDTVLFSSVKHLFAEDTWTVRPTLARDIITVEWQKSLASESMLSIFNLSGQKTYSQTLSGQASTIEVPVEELTPGIYLLVIENEGRIAVKRFVKE